MSDDVGPLICKIPLDPKIQALIDKGQSIFEEPVVDSPVISRYHEIQSCKHHLTVVLANKFPTN